MSDNPKEAEKEMEKAIFISADCWLNVFDLLPPVQLGLGIALISSRFDCFVDEHFKTRKWKLGEIKIRRKIGHFCRFAMIYNSRMNSANEMEIVNSDGKELPIPHKALPNKIIGFKRILIHFFDHTVLTFVDHFHRFFASCTTKLYILSGNDCILEFAVLNILPMFKDAIRQMSLKRFTFYHIRQFAPSILCQCPSLHTIFCDDDIFPEFPADDNANASDGQAMAKWLFSTPRPDNLPKMLRYEGGDPSVNQWSAMVEQIKAAFSSASSSAAFVILICFPLFPSLSAVIVPFKLTNEFTGEQLALSNDANVFLLIRSPIAAGDERKWLKEMYGGLTETTDQQQQNQINIFIRDGGVDNCLLDSSPGPSGDQKQKK